ncbi:hypothetical protein [Methanoculleus frigidifontis]|uniref:hypothetical protein n=1 Tax=Methanoculleus frigidifontis TaxID=2584085 RepID=UPI0026580585|nr:hypothetical protein [Methanoculleus sp. FWC-SCC1]
MTEPAADAAARRLWVSVYAMRKVGESAECVVDADPGPEMLAGFVEPSANSELSTEA